MFYLNQKLLNNLVHQWETCFTSGKCLEEFPFKIVDLQADRFILFKWINQCQGNPCLTCIKGRPIKDLKVDWSFGCNLFTEQTIISAVDSHENRELEKLPEDFEGAKIFHCYKVLQVWTVAGTNQLISVIINFCIS